MKALLEFYQPYVSDDMPKRFQYWEIVTPLIQSLAFSALAQLILFYHHYWFWSALSFLLFFLLLNTIRGGLYHTRAERLPGGRLYISPSCDSSLSGGVTIISLLCCSVFLLATYGFLH
ncbi:MAG TPA: hypothetical protein VN665_02505 [Candidatus Paceibacterota bacterium]|nr:hypothetical protein [Candidatus Paceibacterota bacterium]